MGISSKYLQFIRNIKEISTTSGTSSELIRDTALLYKETLDLEIVSVYLFDEESFEPELKCTFPEGSEEIVNNMLSKYIEEGLLGEVLNSSESLIKNNNNDGKNILIIPLISTDGALGFILSVSKDDQLSLDTSELECIQIVSEYFALSLYNLKVREINENYKSKIDQLVALRTKALVDSREEISEKIEQLKSSLLVTIPHEVRTPLNQIIGFSGYLIKSLDELEKEDKIEILEDILTSGRRLQRLFENYLYLSNITITSYNLEELEKLYNEYTLSAESAIQEVVYTIAPNYSSDIKVEYQLEDASLKISEQHFRKIISELIDNAFKFSNEEGNIKISSAIENGNYKLEIFDNGSGMPEEKAYMLDAYIQFDRGLKEQQGSGLGLAIVNKILNIYKGSMKIESKPNEFTKVVINIPIANV